MGKSKMDDAAAQRICRARGEKDGFSKRAAEAARRNGQNSHTGPRDLSFSSSSSSSIGGGSSSSSSSSGGEGKIGQKGGWGKK
ncbi:hypothetical protein MYCTH_2095639 [Thermothelomyces thermophilus ATCC 42464]|uniref:Uncharacterized protein n=1 Tax=Thermothelomyces thermophilus (strain ATCC 42464 / BCRC 31852 / DSM 1799) TaxID=573729 RepID=G2QI27_THET4|nr:uncharacterized protein MYCTH_2095639 [Thermothelomyces thermophilus ATCC 42464]AEO60216.1 hypothetical protein MYCTH_2095639 [Thermothelomyces thermophilus ATCC 42464]